MICSKQTVYIHIYTPTGTHSLLITHSFKIMVVFYLEHTPPLPTNITNFFFLNEIILSWVISHFAHSKIFPVSWDFLGSPVVENPPFKAEDLGLIPGQGSQISQAAGQLSPRATTNQTSRYN